MLGVYLTLAVLFSGAILIVAQTRKIKLAIFRSVKRKDWSHIQFHRPIYQADLSGRFIRLIYQADLSAESWTIYFSTISTSSGIHLARLQQSSRARLI